LVTTSSAFFPARRDFQFSRSLMRGSPR
jgi:hypothetical protein